MVEVHKRFDPIYSDARDRIKVCSRPAAAHTMLRADFVFGATGAGGVQLLLLLHESAKAAAGYVSQLGREEQRHFILS